MLNVTAKGKFIFLRQTKASTINLSTPGGLFVPDGVTLPKGLDPSRLAEIVSVGDDAEISTFKDLVGRQVFAAGTCPIILEDDSHRYLYCYKENIVGVLDEQTVETK